MSRSIQLIALCSALAVATFAVHASAQQPRTARDRVYSEAQAGRGRATYSTQCAACHGAMLQGDAAPPLTGDDFIAIWGSLPLLDLVNKIQRTMPADKPGQLTRDQAADLAAFVLQIGKFPAGPTALASSD